MRKYCDSCSFEVYETFRVCPNCGGQSFGAAPNPKRIEPAVEPSNLVNSGPQWQAQKASYVRSAGNWARLFAYLIDAVCLLFLAYITAPILGDTLFRTMSPIDTASVTAVAYLVWWILFVLYFSIFHSSRLQATPGKLAANLQIVTERGEKLTFLRAASRALLSVVVVFVGVLVFGVSAALSIGNTRFDPLVLLLPLLISVAVWYAPYVMLFFNSERQTLFDKICKTRVIKKV